MIVSKGYSLSRPDYSSNLDCGKLQEGFERITSSDSARVTAEIASMHPDVVLAAMPLDLPPSIFQTRIPVSPDSDPFAGKGLIDSIARGMLSPIQEGWRKDVA